MDKTKPEISLDISPDLANGTTRELHDWIRENRVDEVECVIPDMAGVARGKVMPASKYIKESEVRLPISIFISTITGGYPEVNIDGYDDLKR